MLEVIWNDIVDNPNWQDQEESGNADTAKIKTLGYYIGKKNKNIIIAHSVAEDLSTDSMVIPWSNIDKINILG